VQVGRQSHQQHTQPAGSVLSRNDPRLRAISESGSLRDFQ
jgi:hypothetical protein